jgi:NAD(P)-dependent dehydrogenase (short-subunit alcohol dehydrogenase family)
MNYFVTGATGFIGKFLLEKLLAREGAKVHVLVRPSSVAKFEELKERYGEAGKKLVMVPGDITEPGLVSPADFKKLAGKIDHVFHLAAVYDMTMSDEQGDRINNEGTRNLVAFVNDLGGDVRLHHVSSVAVAGSDYVGIFKETMFDEGQTTNHPYYRTKFQSEAIVRNECAVPWRIYRPGVVVGHSETGEMDKIDGPYYFAKAIQKISYRVPKWLPLLGIEGGKVAIAPVDYVAAAMDAIAHAPKLDGQCFHLMQSQSPTVGDLLQCFLEAAHGPEFGGRLDIPALPPSVKKLMGRIGKSISSRNEQKIAEALGVPLSVLGYAFNQAVFDDREARRALKGTGIVCPDIKHYADKLWQYWELQLDLKVKIPPRLRQKLSGKVVLVTGASSGIGFAAAKKIAAAGAKVLLVARTREKLEETKLILEKAGGEAHVYPCDLNSLTDIDRMSAEVLRDFGHVDVLINNAGRSIRRAVFESFDRFHDFERTMQLNYFGAVRLIMNLLPAMARQKSGHIINISSIGVLANAARFSAYVASKAALDAYTRCLSAEVKARNIHTTAIYMPLVRTPMIAPTKMYDYIPTWSPEDAADTVVKAILDRPKSIATSVGTAAAVSYAIWPKANDWVLSKGFQLFPSSGAAKGKKDGGEKLTLEQTVFANIFKGEHW